MCLRIPGFFYNELFLEVFFFPYKDGCLFARMISFHSQVNLENMGVFYQSFKRRGNFSYRDSYGKMLFNCSSWFGSTPAEV